MVWPVKLSKYLVIFPERVRFCIVKFSGNIASVLSPTSSPFCTVIFFVQEILFCKDTVTPTRSEAKLVVDKVKVSKTALKYVLDEEVL